MNHQENMRDGYKITSLQHSQKSLSNFRMGRGKSQNRTSSIYIEKPTSRARPSLSQARHMHLQPRSSLCRLQRWMLTGRCFGHGQFAGATFEYHRGDNVFRVHRRQMLRRYWEHVLISGGIATYSRAQCLHIAGISQIMAMVTVGGAMVNDASAISQTFAMISYNSSAYVLPVILTACRPFTKLSIKTS